MSQTKHKISKSRFVSGMQCEKKLYFDLYRQDLRPPISESQQQLFDKGTDIGFLAQQVFPNGKDASPKSYYDFSESLANTKQWVEEGIPTIYEASFLYDEALCALDILHFKRKKLWAIEVKSSSSVKDYHITDCSFQYWVMTQWGYKPDKFFLMHINNEYFKKGPIQPKKLFTLADITEQVKANLDWVGENLKILKELKKGKEPKIEIGKHCFSPFECVYRHHCWKEIPEVNSVFDLTNARGKSWDLYEEGILHLSEIPEDFHLTPKQQIQVRGVKFKESVIEKDSIQSFLDGCRYPLYFFDFETVFPAIPILNETSPFQQIPFQYSLQFLHSPNGELEHREFLADPNHFSENSKVDPRLELILQMEKDLGKNGSIIAYNASFEMNVIKGLANAYPKHATRLNSLIERFVDLYLVFRERWYYTPNMGNSASIKSVLPAIDPSFNYSNLEISEGGEASNTFLAMIDGTLKADLEEKRKQLLEYCKRDTEGMVVIWKKLVSLVTNESDSKN